MIWTITKKKKIRIYSQVLVPYTGLYEIHVILVENI